MHRHDRKLAFAAVLATVVVAAIVLANGGAHVIGQLAGPSGAAVPPRASNTEPRVPTAHGLFTLAEALRVAAADAIAGLILICAVALLLVKHRLDAREQRNYALYEIHLSMHDNARPRDLKDMVEALAAAVRRWPIDRARHGQPYFAFELHYGPGRGAMEFLIALRCEQAIAVTLQSVIANAYPDVRVGHVRGNQPVPLPGRLRQPGYVLRFRKERPFIYPLTVRDEDEEASPTMEAIAQTQVMAGVPSSVRLQFTPAPLAMEGWSRHKFRAHEDHLARSEQRMILSDAGLRSVLNQEEMRDAGRAQNSALFWFEVQVAAPTSEDANRIAAALIARRGENRLQRRRMILRQPLYRQRFPGAYPPLLPTFGHGRFNALASAAEVAHLLTLPSARMKAVPIRRLTVPRLPPPPEIARTRELTVRTADSPSEGHTAGAPTMWLPRGVSASNGRSSFDSLPYIPYPVADSDIGPVFLHPSDRKYGTLMVGGQGSGKTSAMLRLALNDVMDPDAALIVFDPKSELSTLLLGLIPPDCGKRVWYLDLGHPAFGMTPLRLPQLRDWATEATGIAEGIVSALLDINEGQIFQSSKRYLYHAVIGELAMARLEDQRRPQFEGVYGLLMPKRKDLREAAANACNQFPDLDQTAEFFAKELPDDLEMAGSAVAQRLDAPRNKISTLVGIPALRRFFNHPSDVPISRIIKARDILLIDANMAAIGQDNAEACIAFIFRALHQHMQHQVQWPEHERPRVAVIADEAHYLVSENVVDQIATHRAAGLDVTLGLQFFAQLGASAQSAAATEKIRSGVLNLVQSRFMFRLGNPEDAEEATRIAMAVYETMIRADSREYQRATPEQILNLPVWRFLASWIANGSRASSFIGGTYAFPTQESAAWREHHLERLRSVVQPYPEDMGHTYRRQVDPKAMKHLATEWTERERNRAAAATDAATDRDGDGAPEREPIPPTARPAAADGQRSSPGPTEQPSEVQPSEAPPSDAIAGDAAEAVGGAGREQLELPDFPPPQSDGSTAPRVPRRRRPARGDPDVNADGSPRVDNYELLPLPDLELSDVRRLVGRAPRGGAQAAHERALQASGGEAPWLLREFAFVDRYSDRGELRSNSGEPAKLSISDKSALQVLDRVGLVLRDSLGRAALGPDAALRTVQYRLKRLYDAGYIARAEITIVGGSSRLPQIYAITSAGMKAAQAETPPVIHPERKHRAPEGHTMKIKHDHHALHWLLQLQELLGPDVVTDYWRTDRYATGRLTPPQVGGGRSRHQVTLNDIKLSGGQMIAGLRATEPTRREGPTRGFREIRPDVAIELHVEHARRGDGQPGLTFDLLVELDRSKPSHNEEKFTDYDALLTAWWSEHRRYSTLGTRPVVVFVHQTWERAQQNAARADQLMTGGIGHSGTPPQTWYYAGRDHTFFMAEEDIYHGSLRALALHRWPPRLRDALGQGAHPQPEVVSLMPPPMTGASKRAQPTG
jgi:hypothetical protein